MNQSQVAIVDFSDVRRWKLLIRFAATGISAVLYDNYEIHQVVDKRWEYDETSLLRNIENAVYDNPILLDQYEGAILIDTDFNLFFPEVAKSHQDLIDATMNEVYDIAEDDIFYQDIKDGVMAYALVSGLKSFLQRTFPGMAVMNQFGAYIKRFGDAVGLEPRVYAFADDAKVDILSFAGNSLLHASTHRCREYTDIAYYLFNVWRELGYTPDSASLVVAAPKEMRKSLLPLMRRHINYVTMASLPASDTTENIVPALLSILPKI